MVLLVLLKESVLRTKRKRTEVDIKGFGRKEKKTLLSLLKIKRNSKIQSVLTMAEKVLR